MISKQQFISQLIDRQYLRRNLLIGVGLVALVAAVLFLPSLNQLFQRPEGSRAEVLDDDDLNRIWENLEKEGAHKAAHSKMIAVTQGGQRWLYVIGGIETQFNFLENRYQTVISSSVRRIQLDASKGTVTGSEWQGEDQTWGKMKFGHAEFGLVEVGGYLYVIAGDINIPPVVENQNQSALLYSTIERLNLANPSQGWEVFSLLSGVNFYPEVLVEGSDIHVVGGIYGNPFPPLIPEVADTYIQDMLDPATDYSLWNQIKNKPVIGQTGLFLTHTQTNGGLVTTTQPNIITIPNGSGGGTNGPGIPELNGNNGPSTQSSIPDGSTTRVASDVLAQQIDGSIVRVFEPSTGDVHGTGELIDVVLSTNKTDGQANQVWDSSIQIRANSSDPWEQVLVTPLFFRMNQTREVRIPVDLVTTQTTTAQIRVCFGATSVAQCDGASFPADQIGLSELFTVTNNDLVVHAGPKWYRGNSHTITWDTLSGHSHTALFWKTSGSSSWNPIAVTPNDHSYDWQIPAEIGTGTIQIRGCLGDPTTAPSCNGQQDISDNISLVNHSVSIVLPNANSADLKAGNTTPIQWVADSDRTHAILWWKRGSQSNQYWKMITNKATSGPTGGTYNWKVPDELTNEAQIAICLTNTEYTNNDYISPQNCAGYSAQYGFGYYDLSEQFGIGEGVNFKVTSPNGGEFLAAGTTHKITWNSNSTDSIRVEFSANNGTNWQLLTSLVAGSQSFDWAIPSATPATTQGLIRISDTGGSNRSDVSDTNFIIVSGPISSTKLTEALISGKFVTTVGEHFVINTQTVGSSKSGELKSDYIGSLTNTWTPNTVARLGHLRFMITQSGEVIPVPQGRYGHKLVRSNFGGGSFGVIGGATWAKEQSIMVNGVTERFKTFWVIDHNTHPVYRTNSSHFDFHYGKDPVGNLFAGYQFVGNIAYTYIPSRAEGNRWIGSNGGMGSGNYSGAQLDAKYALKASGVPKGRAFFGLAEIPGNMVVVGGLENAEISGDAYEHQSISNDRYFRISVNSTARAERLKSAGWSEDLSYTEALNRNEDNGYKPAYNLTAVNLGSKAVVYGGQTDFQKVFTTQEGRTLDAHVPDYTYSFGPKTFMYKPTDDPSLERWFAMGDMGISGVGGNFSYVRVTPGAATISEGSQVKFTAHAYSANGLELSGANCTWARKSLASSLGSIDSSGVFTAVDSISGYRIATKGIEATCTIGDQTQIGYADIGVYPASSSAPQPVLSLVEVTPGSAVIIPGGKRNFKVTAYDQYYNAIKNNITYKWSLSDDDAGTIGPDGGQVVVFTANKDKQSAGSHLKNLQATVTQQETTGNRTRFATADIHIPESLFADGNSAESFASDYVVDTDGIKAIYHFGGVESDHFQTLGLFGSGKITGSLDVVTSPIAPDGYYGSDVIIRLKNGLDEPVFQDGNGNRFAVRIDTSRSAGPLVTTDQSFRPGKTERVELNGEPMTGPAADGEAVFVDANGEARFRIYSNQETTSPITVRGYVMTDFYSMQVIDLTDSLEVRNVAGVPSQLTSTIVTDKYKVAADGIDQANVTVTLRDFQGTPVSGYHVKVTSSRNEIDTISPTTRITNTSGEAQFTVSSDTKGLATIRAFFAPNAVDLGSRPTPLLETLSLEFSASISSLVPNTIRQGETIDSVVATGNQTSWATDKTTVSYVSPSRTGVAINNPNPHIKANGVTKTTMSIVAPTFPNRQVALTLTGSGSFYPAGTTTVTTNSSGNASFVYQSGNVAGIVKIKAQIAGGANQPSDETWFMLEDARDHPYELSIFASPAQDLGPGGQTLISGSIYQYVGTQKVLVTDSLEFSFVTDSGTFSNANVDSNNGVARSTFTRGSVAGPAQILVTSQFNGVPLGARMIINQTDDSSDLTHSTMSVSGLEGLSVTNLQATPDAIIGNWTFRVTTDISPDGTASADRIFEVVDYPLQVVSNTTAGGPRLTNIDPNIGYRNANDMVVDIYGNDAFFQSNSVVNFTPVTGSSTGVVVATTTLVSVDHLRVTLDISNTAFMGYWNVKVTTGNRVAELAGDYDFLVTTPNNVVVDVVPNPNRIPRDGRARSNVDIFVGRLDPVTGAITPLSGVEVVLGFVGTDGGRLDPIKDPLPPDAQGIKTNSNGVAKTVYFTDAGDESDDVLIQATVTIDGAPTANTGLIIKEVDTGHTFQLTASPASLTATGGNSTLTATVLDRSGNPVINGTPVEFILVGVGAIIPDRTTVTGGQGRATSTYQVGPQSQPQLPRIVAKATIEGVGVVYSNDVVIPVGVDASKYRLTVATDKTSVGVGVGERANITATLTYNNGTSFVPVNNWPIVFGLNYHQAGDYLTTLSITTNASGQATTAFVPGLITGNILLTATPLALTPGQVIITKTTGQTVSRELSTISAVPKYVPADGNAYSLITVTVRNGSNIGLAGKSVSLTASLGNISPTSSVTTNSLGQAFFYVRSSTIGTSGIEATVDGIKLNTQVYFQNGLVQVLLDTIVPLEYRAYDHQVKLYLREPVSGASPVIDESYYTNSTDHVLGLPPIYLKPNTTYTYWAKGRFHLARTKTLQVTSPTSTAVNFSATHKGTPNKGLLIGDIAPDTTAGLNGGSIPSIWHDNAINALDVTRIFSSWPEGRYQDEPDLNYDTAVNSLDFTVWSYNYGAGEPLP